MMFQPSLIHTVLHWLMQHRNKGLQELIHVLNPFPFVSLFLAHSCAVSIRSTNLMSSRYLAKVYKTAFFLETQPGPGVPRPLTFLLLCKWETVSECARSPVVFARFAECPDAPCQASEIQVQHWSWTCGQWSSIYSYPKKNQYVTQKGICCKVLEWIEKVTWHAKHLLHPKLAHETQPGKVSLAQQYV